MKRNLLPKTSLGKFALIINMVALVSGAIAVLLTAPFSSPSADEYIFYAFCEISFFLVGLLGFVFFILSLLNKDWSILIFLTTLINGIIFFAVPREYVISTWLDTFSYYCIVNI